MEEEMKFARIVFAIAAVYGIITLLPLYFLLERIGREAPPAVTHPEFYYGFVGVVLLWQFVFNLIAKDPIRYRPIMLIAICEKLVYTVPVLILFSLGEVSTKLVAPSLVDPIFGVLFIVAYARTREALALDANEYASAQPNTKLEHTSRCFHREVLRPSGSHWRLRSRFALLLP
jgi:hypothetical protein